MKIVLFSVLTKVKMPITHVQDKEFDFSTATVDEKKQYICWKNKKRLAEFLIRCYPADFDLKIFLMFVWMICTSKFGDYFVIPEEDFS